MPGKRHNLDKGGARPGSPVEAGDGGAVRKPVVTTAQAASASSAPPASGKVAVPASSFEARFGRIILQHGIAAIPSALYHWQGEVGLKAQHVWFISYILAHKWDEDLPYPSLSKMARCTGITLRNLQLIRKELGDAGLLLVHERFTEKGGQDSNAYDFSPLFAILEALLEKSAPTPNPINAGDAPVPNAVGNDPSFVARFGRVIARHGVAAVPRALFTHQGALELTPQQVWFISYIFSFQWTAALPYPSINRMVQHTGYSRAHLHTIKAELVKGGYLRLVHRSNEQGGQDSNAYDFSGLLEAIRAQLQPDSLQPEDSQTPPEEEAQPKSRDVLFARRGRSAAQARRHGEAGGDGGVGSKSGGEEERTGEYVLQQTGVYEEGQTGWGERRQTPLHEHEHTGPVRGASHRSMKKGGPSPANQGGHEIETSIKETNDKNDSNQLYLKRDRSNVLGFSTASTPYSPYIAQVVADFSYELGDPDHVGSNVTQALRLWQASGLDEQEYVACLYNVKTTTRKYQTRPYQDSMQSKMAYFFVVLRSVLSGPGPKREPGL